MRYAFRHLRRSPGFAFAAILTLAIGVGANTAIFSVLNALVLRPLAIPDPARLIGISALNTRGQPRLTLVTAIDVLKSENGPLEGLCAYNGAPVLATEANGVPAQAVVEFVTAECLPTFGVQPLIGRVFAADEAPAARKGAPVAVLGYRFWQRMYGGDPNVVGRTLKSEGETLTILGVMPAGFHGLQVDTGVDIIAPFGTIVPSPPNRPPGAFLVIGRLRSGVTAEQARAHFTTRWPALIDTIMPATLSPAERNDFREVTINVETAGWGLSGLRIRYARAAGIVLGLTLLLLVLACVNLSGLLLARLEARHAELVVRRALGASESRLIGQLLAESLMLALAGTALAIPLAFALIRPLASLIPIGLVERAVSLAPDLRVLAAATAAGAVTGFVMNVVPAWIVMRQRSGLSQQSRRTVASATSTWGRVLLAGQVAASIVLLVGAGLLARSLYLLVHVNHGYATHGILSSRLMPTPGAYRDLNAAAYYPELVRQVSAVPGVRSAGYARLFSGLVNDAAGMLPIGFVDRQDRDTLAVVDATSPGFFETVGIPLIAGRLTDWSDNATTRPVAVVSQSLARALDPAGDVIGRHVRVGTDAVRKDLEIVGVVGNGTVGNLRSTAPPVIYRPALQEGRFAYYPILQVATNEDIPGVADGVRDAVRKLGREYVHDLMTLDQRLGRSASTERLTATLAAAIAAIAVLLAFIGVYGLLAYGVVRRAREIAVRVALGATAPVIMRMVLRDGIIPTLAGIAVGIPAAVAAARVLDTVMYGVPRYDPVTLTAVVVFFLLLGLGAGLLPARRAATIDPMVTLRAE